MLRELFIQKTRPYHRRVVEPKQEIIRRHPFSVPDTFVSQQPFHLLRRFRSAHRSPKGERHVATPHPYRHSTDDYWNVCDAASATDPLAHQHSILECSAPGFPG